MNKQDLIKKIQQQESELAELKAQVEKLKEPEKKTGRVLSLDGFEKGYRVFGGGVVDQVGDSISSIENYFNTGSLFYDNESGERYVKYLELWQEARMFMADDWGDEKVDWEKTSQSKYVIYCHAPHTGVLHKVVNTRFHHLHLKSRNSRYNFRQQFSDDDIKLMLMGV